MRILIENTAGLIIDIQEKLFPFIQDNDQLIRNNRILIHGLKELSIPMVVTQQYTRGLGETIQPLANAIGEFDYIEKTAFSCCDDARFRSQLELLDKEFIIVTGIEAHVCVLQTTIDLLEAGYTPVVVQDCISSRRLNDKEMAIERMRKEGAVITTYESILFELLRFSGTDQFKAISKLVK